MKRFTLEIKNVNENTSKTLSFDSHAEALLVGEKELDNTHPTNYMLTDTFDNDALTLINANYRMY